MEIKNLMSKCSGAKSSVILHLAFEKDMGNISLDTSGLKNDAAIMGITPLMPSLGMSRKTLLQGLVKLVKIQQITNVSKYIYW